MSIRTLAASCLAIHTALGPSEPAGPPLRLAIYYGYPSLVNGAAGALERAVAVFAQYDLIVFGDGLELSSRPDDDAGLRAERLRVGPIIDALHRTPRHPRIYGYVDLGSSQALPPREMAERLARWRALGADGVFFDEAGRDFGVTSDRRRGAVRAAHERGLAVLANSSNPDDLFDAAAEGDTEGRLDGRDGLLLESFAIVNGEFEAADRVAARAAAALAWRRRYGVRVFAATTASGAAPFDDARLDYAWFSAAAWGLDGLAWGERDYSVDSQLPWRPRPAAEARLEGARPAGPATAVGAVVRRLVSAGAIAVDHVARKGWFEPR